MWYEWCNFQIHNLNPDCTFQLLISEFSSTEPSTKSTVTNTVIILLLILLLIPCYPSKRYMIGPTSCSMPDSRVNVTVLRPSSDIESLVLCIGYNAHYFVYLIHSGMWYLCIVLLCPVCTRYFVYWSEGDCKNAEMNNNGVQFCADFVQIAKNAIL